jgi:hypothetical protein
MSSNRDVSISDSYIGTGLNVKIKMRTLNGLANANASLDPPTTCSTGNCTFRDTAGPRIYHTAGFCHQCWNSAANLEDHSTANRTGSLELPNGVAIDPTLWAVMNISTSASLDWIPAARDPASASVMLASETGTNMTVLTKSYLPCQDAQGHQGSFKYARCYVAASCALYPCLKSYTGEIANGKLIENIDSTTPMLKAELDSDIFESSGVGWPCRAENEIYDIGNITTATSRKHKSLQRVRLEDGTVVQVPSQCVYTMDYSYRGAVASYLKSLTGKCVEPRANPDSLSCQYEKSIELFYNGGNATFKTIDDGLERITRTITNRMREIGVQSSNSSAPSVVTGTAQQTFVCTRFEWYWLLMPAILLLAAALLLATVVLGGLFDRQAHPIWKSSVLPLLLHGPQSVGKADEQVSTDMVAMTGVTKDTIVTLRRDDNGTWQLLRENESTVYSRRSRRLTLRQYLRIAVTTQSSSNGTCESYLA